MRSTELTLAVLMRSQRWELVAESGSARASEVASSTSFSTWLGPWKNSLTLKLIEDIPAVIFRHIPPPPIRNCDFLLCAICDVPFAQTFSIVLRQQITSYLERSSE